ncbi:TPA: 16S rRNA (cytosine(967)-C(5))-methyltransferase RsmB [bacterium]|nr:16S rRNA (cytosine(967)-C(5))-methyltransferase RsmB [bacterium]
MNVRLIALNALIDIISKKGYSNLVVNQTINKSNLSPQDRSLLTKIVYGTLQNYYLLEWEVNKYISNKTNSKIKLLLLMSCYQLRFLDNVPSYAIINEAVSITKVIHCSWAAGFVNAVLRKLNDNPQGPKLDDFKAEFEYYSIKYSYPYWLIKMWVKHYGEEVTLKILQDKREPNISLRVNTLKTTKENLLKNPSFIEGNLSPDALIYKGEEGLGTLQELKDGLVVVQDEASQMSALTLNPSKNTRVLDMCAAPGTKSTHLAQIMENTGEITAIDLHEHRVELIKESLIRLGVNSVKTLVYDSTKLEELYQNESFDYILLDAPCSGFGVAKRKPDILINTHQESLDEIINLQSKLLKVASNLLKKGGFMVYSTCTLNKKENELQIANLLKERKDIKLINEQTIYPFLYDSDGFYIARLEKVGV